MTKKITRWSRAALMVAAVAGAASACSRSQAERTSSGDVDRTSGMVVLATPAPGVQITRTDVSSVARAAAYRLTAQNFAAFMKAVDSVGTLARRDSAVRGYLAVSISDAGPANADAGLRWLRANAKVANAIQASGISVDDYYVASIAVVNAEHELLHPKATPADNAEFLRMHTEDLARLHQVNRAR
jgi:hypothetical protein